MEAANPEPSLARRHLAPFEQMLRMNRHREEP